MTIHAADMGKLYITTAELQAPSIDVFGTRPKKLCHTIFENEISMWPQH